VPPKGLVSNYDWGTVNSMSAPTRRKRQDASRGAWPDYLAWIRRPSIRGGIGSLMDLSGVVKIDSSRFHPQADLMLLQRDGRILIAEFKHSQQRAAREIATPQQERLFDPNEA
jgi:hypothetical protein